MAVVRAGAGSFRARTWGRARAGQVPPAPASLRATHPTHEITGQVPRVPELVTRETEALPATQRTVCFPLAHTSHQLSQPPQRQSAPGILGDRGLWPGVGHGSPPGGVAQAGGTHAHRGVLPWGLRDEPCLGGLRVLLWLKLPHPAPSWQTWTEWLPLSKVWPKLREKGL